LCVEDDESCLQHRKAQPEKNGYNVISAMEAETALQMLRESAACLVLSDRMLGATTGAHLASRMKAIKPGVPIVLYSGTVPESMRKVRRGVAGASHPRRRLAHRC